MPWLYKNQPIHEMHELSDDWELLYGFCYRITNLKTGKIYIGMKSFWSTEKRKLTKKELADLPNNRFKKHKHVTKESDWKKYWSSCKELKADRDLLGKDWFKREILALAYSKKYCSFLELEAMIRFDVLRHDSYNGNILGSYYRKDIESTKEGLL